ncbi:hypothetical protein VTN96DRAFT_9353 [Rasamsonia emersonii]
MTLGSLFQYLHLSTSQQDSWDDKDVQDHGLDAMLRELKYGKESAEHVPSVVADLNDSLFDMAMNPETRDVDFGYWVKNRDGSDAIVKVPREVYDQVPEHGSSE